MPLTSASLAAASKGGGEGLVQLPVAQAGGGTVQAPLGLGVAQKVLGNAGHAVRFAGLHTPDVVDAELGDQIRVLAEGLVGAAPAGVPGDVDHRAHGRCDAHGPALFADDGGHLTGQVRPPGARQVHHGGEKRAPCPGVAAQILALQGHGNAQAGLLHKVALYLIGDMGDEGRVRQARQGVLGEPAVAVGEQPAQGVLVHPAVPEESGGQVAAQLGGLFLHRHAGQQILHAGFYRLGWVFVQFHVSHLFFLRMIIVPRACPGF